MAFWVLRCGLVGALLSAFAGPSAAGLVPPQSLPSASAPTSRPRVDSLPSPVQLVVPEASSHVLVLDGNFAPSEWEGAARLRLEANPERPASAELRISYDATLLRIAIEVTDPELVPGASLRPGDGDGVAIVLQRGAARAPPGGLARAREQTICLWCAPAGNQVRYALFEREAEGFAPVASAWSGTRVEGTALPGHGYRLEIALPFPAIYALDTESEAAGANATLPQLGFEWVLFDRTRTHQEPVAHAWSGGFEPTQWRPGAQLAFAGRAPLAENESTAPGLLERLLAAMPHVLVPVGMLAIAALGLFAWSRTLQRWPRLRPLAHGAGVVFLILAVALPPFEAWRRDRGFERRTIAIATLLRDELPRIEEGTLASQKGAQLDGPLLDLLAGKPVAPRQGFTFRALAELAESGFGTAVKRYPGLNCSVLPYWIEIPQGRTERFHFEEALRGHSLYLVFGRPQSLVPRRGREEAPPRVRVAWRAPGASSDAEARELTLDGPFDSSAVFNRDDREMVCVRWPLRDAVAELAFTTLEGEGLQLVGVTLASEPGDAGRALALGLASDTGVATDLRGAEPDEAGIELYPGQRQTVALAKERQRRFERAWLLAAATSRADAAAVPSDTRCGEVVLRYRSGKPPLVIPLVYQTTLFHELTQLNVRVPRADGAEEAFRWLGPRGEPRATYSFGVDVSRDEIVEAVEFVCTGPHRIAFRSLVFGSERLVPPQEAADSPLYVTSEAREVALKPRVREVLGDAWFAIYRGGRLARSTLPAELAQEVAAERRNLPRLGESGEFRPATRELPGGRLYEASVAWSGPGLAGAVLGVFVPDATREARHRFWIVVRIVLCLLAAPALLAWAAQLLSSVGTLRLRLLSVLGVATLLPLGVLTTLLVGVLESEHERTQTEALRRSAADVVERLEVVKTQLAANATSWLETLARLVAGQGALLPADAPLTRLQPLLATVLQGELPRTWSGARMVLEVGVDSAQPVAIAVPHDPFTRPRVAPPVRGGVGFELRDGRLWLAVRSERVLERLGKCALCVERPFDDALLASLDPARTLVLCDAAGVAFAAAVGAEDEDGAAAALLRDVGMLRERRALFAEVSERALTISRRHALAGGAFTGAYRPLSDGVGTPRAMLGVLEPLRRATMATPFGRLPVRSSFAAIAGLVLLVGVFLALVVTSRISKPIEELERGALALRKGELEVRLHDGDTGQIRRLQESFQLMAQELRTRVQDLGALSRAVLDLGAAGDEREVHAQALSFCARQTPADRVRSLAVADDGAILLDGERDAGFAAGSGVAGLLVRAEAPFCLVLGSVPEGDALHATLHGHAHALVVPWPRTGKPLGAFLILFTARSPGEFALEPVIALAAHAASTVDNLRLRAASLEDVVTGALRREPFARRLADEVAAGSRSSSPCSLVAIEAEDPGGEAKDAGRVSRDALARRAAAVLRHEIPPGAVFGRTEELAFRVLLPGRERGEAQALAARFALALAAAAEPSGAVWPRWRTAHASVPEEASSAEFLSDLVLRRLREPATGSAETVLALSAARRADLAAAGVVAATPAMQSLVATLEKVAPTELSVLLEGETGTGKEVLANLVHAWSRRAEGPLVRVHCAAIPANLLQAELFGYEKGAFTGAMGRKLGKFEQAQGGTIFLDEIGEISAEVQVSLLRVLQERVVDRIGGTEPVPIDVRVVTATNRNLREMVTLGTFREDLYYRLHGMALTVPPLRERKAEIPALAERFLREAVAGGQSVARSITPEALDVLFARAWPGNIRELRNLVLRAAVLASQPEIRPADLAGIGEAAPRSPEPPDLVALPVAASAPQPPPVAAAGAESAPAGSAAPEAAASRPPEPASQPEGSQEGPLPGGGSPPAAAPRADATPQLSPRLRALLAFARARETFAAQEVVVALGLSSRTALRELGALLEAGLLERLGTRRGARYRCRAGKADSEALQGEFATPPGLGERTAGSRGSAPTDRGE